MGKLEPLVESATAESIVAKKGTTTTNGAGDGSTVVDTGLTEANDYWNDMTVLILSGASDGQSRDITGFTGGTITVSPVFANQILSGVRYLILPFKPSAAEVSDIKGTGFVKDTDSLVDLAHETDHDVPVEDAATDVQMRDVVGKKSDTVAGTSIVSISKQVKAKTDNIPASPAPSGEYDTELDANISTRAPANEYDTEMARITADVATEAKQDVIDGYHDVPGEDSATDAQIRDVVGKKSDTVAGTSVVSIAKQVKAKTDNIPASPAPANEYDTELDANMSTRAPANEYDTQLDANMSTRAPANEYDTEMARITANVATEAKQDVIDGYHDVPGEDSATDAQIRDVVGKKTDTVAGTSIVAISKQVKAKTDNIPASPAPSGEYDTELDANMSTRAPASEYDTEMARITADVATEAKQDTIDGYHDVPGEDSATDAQIRDVVGKKTDTVAGTSIVSIAKQVKAKTDNLSGANTDEQGSPVWVTATHTTNEFDISSLFTTPLTGTTRRKYSIFLDLTGPAGDAAAWTECTVKVKVEIDGSNARTVDKKILAKTDVAAGEEPGVNIDIPAVAKDVQVTMQFDVALATDQTIYYSIVTEVLE